jgi:N-acetylneuraminic acid mutarotase
MRERRFLSAILFAGVIACAGISYRAGAQSTAPDQWTRRGGSAAGSGHFGAIGVYGTKGTPSPDNIPGARYSATTWTDSANHVWLFGGAGGEDTWVIFNDLWEFDPATNEWTWMSGSSSSGQPPVYGTKGVPAPDNVPGARTDASGWIDKDDNLWVFGGSGKASDDAGSLNELWEFNVSTRQWTWVTGQNVLNTCSNGVCRNAGVYGSMGIPADGNTPGGRYRASSWTDRSGNFWLFGGYGLDSVGKSGPLNDLWMFKPSTRQWTWMGGLSTIQYTRILSPVRGWGWGAAGVYGTQGIPAPGNMPGSRFAALTWSDRIGDLWLFGGNGLDANGNTSDLNDLWKFNPSTSEWAWMGGSSKLTTCVVTYPDKAPVILCWPPEAVKGTLGTPSAGNIPGGVSSATAWRAADGTFWLFGGGDLWGNNLLWELDPASNQWTWMGGDGPTSCGTLGVPAAANLPGAEMRAAGWTDGSGNLWLFGGFGTACVGTGIWLNEVWEYQPTLPASFPTAAPVSFSPVPGTYSSVQSVALTDATPGATIYYTTDGLTTPGTGSTRYGGPITVGATQTIQAVAVAANYLNSENASAKYIINLPVAASPTFSPPAGTYSSAQSVVLTDATQGATIYYTADGTTPNAKSNVYSSPLNVPATFTIKAIAMAVGYTNSDVASAAYIINIPPPDFSISISPSSVTLQAGESGTTTITTKNENGFHAALSFACSGLPVGFSCTFAPQAGSAPPDVSYTTLTVTTSSRVALLQRTGRPLVPAAALGVALGLFGWKWRRLVQRIFLLGMIVGTLSLLNGCGGHTREPSTSILTVTATSQSLQHSTTLSVTVK